MKISKVNHVRSASVYRVKRNRTGLLYSEIGSENKVLLKKHIENRIVQASNLYSVLNETRMTKEEKDLKPVVRGYNQYIKLVAKKDKREQQRKLLFHPKKEDIKFPKKDNGKGRVQNQGKKTEPKTREDIDRFIERCLKKGLRRQETFIQDHFWAFYQFFTGESSFTFPGKKEDAELFLKDLEEDFFKKRQAEQIKKSIEHQDVKVQVMADHGTSKLALSSFSNPEKAALFHLMQQVADRPEQLKDVLYHYTTMLLGAKEDFSFEIPRKEESKNGSGRSDEKGRIDFKALKETLNRWIYGRFLDVKKKTEDPDIRYWLQFEKMFLEKYFSKNENITEEKLNYQTVRSALQGHINQYVLLKFTEMGKAVYHFCDLEPKAPDGEEKVGQILPFFTESDGSGSIRGITSFDYERIKAEELLEKDLSVSVTYAAHTFEQSIEREESHKQRDILLINNLSSREDVLRNLPKIRKNLLRYWGGETQFKNEFDTGKLIDQMQKHLFYLRNYSFHYHANAIKAPEHDMLEQMLSEDKRRVSESVYRIYFSNNCFCFYPKTDLIQLIKKLHSGKREQMAFMPSFQNVLSRKSMDTFFEKNRIPCPQEVTLAEKLKSSLYFILKELYYYDFQRNLSVMLDRIREAYREEEKKLRNSTEKEDVYRLKALKTFKEEVALFDKTTTVSDICQRAVMGYALQNNDNYRDPEMKRKKETYKHMKPLLSKLLLGAFEDYFQKEETVRFLFLPAEDAQSLGDCDLFLKDVATAENHLKEYDDLQISSGDEPFLYAGYVLGKLLSPNQLNLFLGDLKHYIQFTTDIKKRAAFLGYSVFEDNNRLCQELLNLLELCRLQNGQISTSFEDYYTDQEEFACTLGSFVAFADEKEEPTYDALLSFGRDQTKEGYNERLRFYTNQKNPILMRNIELARMYGSYENIAKAIQNRVEQDDVKGLKSMEEGPLKEVFEKGSYRNLEELTALKQYQDLKQKVTLVDILRYSDLLLDLYAALIHWNYLHERDYMYFLLGYYYMRQWWPTEGGKKHYPMLSNIVRLFCYGRPLIWDIGLHRQLQSLTQKQEELIKDSKKSNNRILTEDNMGMHNKALKLRTWFGLEFTEVENLMTLHSNRFFDVKETEGNEENGDNLTDQKRRAMEHFRNYIDHFEFFKKHDFSLLELYRNMYYYMGYDRKLQNGVLVKFTNILEKHFLYTHICWNHTDNGLSLVLRQPSLAEIRKMEGHPYFNQKKDSKGKKSFEKLPEDVSLVSKTMVYKIDDKEYYLPAREIHFLQNAEALLIYKEKSRGTV